MAILRFEADASSVSGDCYKHNDAENRHKPAAPLLSRICLFHGIRRNAGTADGMLRAVVGASRRC
jgi:hypothetical protein